MVTVNELFAGFVSVPVKLATPVSAMEPACVAITLSVTVIVELPFSVEALQVTVPPAAPGAGGEQVPRDVLADANCRLGGRLLVNTTALQNRCPGLCQCLERSPCPAAQYLGCWFGLRHCSHLSAQLLKRQKAATNRSLMQFSASRSSISHLEMTSTRTRRCMKEHAIS